MLRRLFAALVLGTLLLAPLGFAVWHGIGWGGFAGFVIEALARAIEDVGIVVVNEMQDLAELTTVEMVDTTTIERGDDHGSVQPAEVDHVEAGAIENRWHNAQLAQGPRYAAAAAAGRLLGCPYSTVLFVSFVSFVLCVLAAPV